MGGLALDGRPPAREIEAQVAARVAALRLGGAGGNGADGGGGRPPTLAVLLVGPDRTAARHGQLKERACRRVGIAPLPIRLAEETTTAEVLARIDRLNGDPGVDGVFLQHPVPRHVDERACFDRIAIGKDVGGDSSGSLGLLAAAPPPGGGGGGEGSGESEGGAGGFAAATPAAILRLLSYYGVALAGKRAVVVGRSPMVGKPMALLLLGANSTVTICHSRTRELPEIVRLGEIVVGAVGKPELIKGHWIRDGAVVIDAGYHPVGGAGGPAEGVGGVGGVGDVELAAVQDRCSAYTPVPGGVGPMTVAVLLANTVAAAERSAGGAVRTGPPRGRPR